MLIDIVADNGERILVQEDNYYGEPVVLITGKNGAEARISLDFFRIAGRLLAEKK